MIIYKKYSIVLKRVYSIPYTRLSIGNEDQYYRIKYKVYKNNKLLLSFVAHSSNIINIETDIEFYNDINFKMEKYKFIRIMNSLRIENNIIKNFIIYLKNNN